MSENKIALPSRRIKFRIWNNKTRSWIHGPHENPSLDGVNLFGETIMFGELLRGVSIEDYNECIPLQYTGLKDSKGKEIFEGDIISQPVYDGWKFGESKNYVIQWWQYSNHSYYGAGWYAGHNNIDKAAEIVGNIFENPELLIHD
jgi:hypothetical protein